MKNEPAFPRDGEQWYVPTEGAKPEIVGFKGLTKREYFAVLMANALIQRDNAIDTKTCARKAVSFADALIEELDKSDFSGGN
jgi:hypothetical protein